tara:strand:- start:39368 stop:39658 length:291 start_codon:yes stop_codon:yes gene_type:complete
MSTLHVIEDGELGSWVDDEIGTITILYVVQRESGRGTKGDSVICHATATGFGGVSVGYYDALDAIDGDVRARHNIGFKLYRWRDQHTCAPVLPETP